MISKFKFFAASLSACLLAAQPCAAASLQDSSQHAFRNGAFAGGTLRVGLDRRVNGQRPYLSLGISRIYQQAGSASLAQRVEAPGVELRFFSPERPLLFLGGQNASSLKQRLGFGPVGAVLVVGGVVAAAVAASALSDPELNRRQCLLPEKELCGS